MRSTSFALAPVIVLLASTVSFAQSSSPRIFPTSRRAAPPEAAHHHSSTAYEGALRGRAAVIAALGDYLQDESQAALVWEYVESMHYDNQLKKTATALTRKRILADFREYERQIRRDRQEAAKQLWQETYLDLAYTYRLDEYEFNWSTGAIYWPAAVASPRYALHRQKLESLIGQAARYGVADSRIYRDQIESACNNFRLQLCKDAVQDHPSVYGEYMAAKRFLLGLKYAPYLMAQTSTEHFLARN